MLSKLILNMWLLHLTNTYIRLGEVNKLQNLMLNIYSVRINHANLRAEGILIG